VTSASGADAELSRGSVLLRPLEAADYPSLRRAELSANVALTWRYGGAHPSPESYAASLWDGVYSHFICFSVERALALGLFTVYDHDPSNRLAAFSAIRFVNDLRSRTEFLVGVYLAMQHAFAVGGVRKLYLETPSYNFENLRSFVTRKIFVVEGKLVDHQFRGGRYWDKYILAATPASLDLLNAVIRSISPQGEPSNVDL